MEKITGEAKKKNNKREALPPSFQSAPQLEFDPVTGRLIERDENDYLTANTYRASRRAANRASSNQGHSDEKREESRRKEGRAAGMLLRQFSWDNAAQWTGELIARLEGQIKRAEEERKALQNRQISTWASAAALSLEIAEREAKISGMRDKKSVVALDLEKDQQRFLYENADKLHNALDQVREENKKQFGVNERGGSKG